MFLIRRLPAALVELTWENKDLPSRTDLPMAQIGGSGTGDQA
jgi:hypothetical protein